MKVLIDENGRKFLVDGRELHTDRGLVRIEPGKGTATSHIGHRFIVLDPDILDIYEKMPRSGSFMLKKDIGSILVYLGLGNGDIIVDAGTGSGSLALFMGNVIEKNGGRVITYEKNPEFAEVARKNIERAGLNNIIEVKVQDAMDGFEEPGDSVDAVTLDMHQAWRMINEARRVLRRGGRIAVYTPYVEHAKEAHLKLNELGFAEIKTRESIEREIEFKTQGSRPKTSRVGHSGYLTFARKT
jgi:tRNA (adenine57-N1/adenine58-N1)-methyltransferase